MSPPYAQTEEEEEDGPPPDLDGGIQNTRGPLPTLIRALNLRFRVPDRPGTVRDAIGRSFRARELYRTTDRQWQI